MADSTKHSDSSQSEQAKSLLPDNEAELSFDDRSGEWTAEAKKRLSQQRPQTDSQAEGNQNATPNPPQEGN